VTDPSSANSYHDPSRVQHASQTSPPGLDTASNKGVEFKDVSGDDTSELSTRNKTST
jgi:hypothetical protein